MTDGTILFIVITLVVIGDVGIALYFRSLADRVESGEKTSSSIDPDGARRTATMLLFSAPLIWLIMTLIAFGVIPTSITPVQF